jgi:hypothetical protein
MKASGSAAQGLRRRCGLILRPVAGTQEPPGGAKATGNSNGDHARAVQPRLRDHFIPAEAGIHPDPAPAPTEQAATPLNRRGAG